MAEGISAPHECKSINHSLLLYSLFLINLPVVLRVCAPPASFIAAGSVRSACDPLRYSQYSSELGQFKATPDVSLSKCQIISDGSDICRWRQAISLSSDIFFSTISSPKHWTWHLPSRSKSGEQSRCIDSPCTLPMVLDKKSPKP